MKTGEIFGGYELLRQIGGGTTGQVWEAQRVGSAESVALKILREDRAEDPLARQAFVKEAALLAGRELPGVATVQEVVQDGDRPALVMDLVEGSDLRRLVVAEAPLRPSTVCLLTAQVARALAAAHAQGIVHRDLKPENVLVEDRDGQRHALVTDFGLARELEAQTVTKASGLLGTVDYLPPEVISGAKATATADVYALGVILYECLAGWRPFRGAHAAGVLEQHLRGVLHRPTGLPEGLWELLRKLLARESEDRPATTEVAYRLTELANELVDQPALARTEPPDPVLEDAGRLLTEQAPAQQPVGPQPPSQRRRLAAALAGILLLIGVVVGAQLWPEGTRDTRAAVVEESQQQQDDAEESPDDTATDPQEDPLVEQTSPPGTTDPIHDVGGGGQEETTDSDPGQAGTQVPGPDVQPEPERGQTQTAPEQVAATTTATTQPAPTKTVTAQPAPTKTATAAPAPTKTAAPAAPTCPGAGCQGRSAKAAGCDDAKAVLTKDITNSQGNPAGTVKILWSAKCSSALGALQVAVDSPLRARLQFFEGGTLVDDDNAPEPRKYASTLMSHLEPGQCVTATGSLGYLGSDGWYPDQTITWCR